MIWSKDRTVGACLMAFLALLGPAIADAPNADALYLSAKALMGQVGSSPDGMAFKDIPTGPGSRVLVARRDKVGDVEVHQSVNDIFFAESGAASVTVGGQVQGNHEISAGEWRGGTLTGGRDYHLSMGDYLWIPAGVPHQVKPIGGSFVYVTVKTPTKP